MAGTFDAIILAGGGARRLGGVDKAALVVRGQTLLDHVVAECAAAGRIVVVGPSRAVASNRRVLWASEDPPGGGPVAGIAAGLPQVFAPLVAVLACDLPYLTEGAIQDLRAHAAAQPDHDGAIFLDADNRDQPLVGVYRREALARALGEISSPGAALRHLLDRLDVVRILDVEGVTRDCDTWDEVEVARRDR